MATSSSPALKVVTLAVAGLAILGGISLLALRTPTPAEASAPAGDPVLVRGNGTEPESLDPAKSETVETHYILLDLFEGLVTVDKDSNVLPGAATSWEMSPDGLTYTFHLRPGLVWSNGDPLTAEDFVYSFRRALDPQLASVYSFLFYPILNAEEIVNGKIKDPTELGVRAIDDHTLEVKVHEPTPYFLTLMAHEKFMPVNRRNVEEWGRSFIKPGHLVSNGAFTLKEWTPHSRIVLERNPRYYDAAKVKLSGVIYLPIDSSIEEINRFRTGELDLTDTIPTAQADYVRRNLPDAFHAVPAFSLYYYGFNMTKPPFAGNLKLRQALAMTIDREAIVERITRRNETPAYSFVPPGVPGYTPAQVDWASWPMDKRIETAKRLYAEAGYGPDNPLKIEIRYNTLEDHQRIAIAIADMWHQTLGVESSLANEEFRVFLETRHEKKLTQVFRDAWNGDYLDPTTFLDLMVTDSGENDPGYSNPAFDKLYTAAKAETNPAERNTKLAAAEKLMLADLPVIPIYYASQPHLVAPYVKGYWATVCEYIYSKNMSIEPHSGTASSGKES